MMAICMAEVFECRKVLWSTRETNNLLSLNTRADRFKLQLLFQDDRELNKMERKTDVS